jgi:micrococcal nuclease
LPPKPLDRQTRLLLPGLILIALASGFAVKWFIQGSEVKGGWYKVESVTDGDTIRLTNGERVRYIGIDSPEMWNSVGSISEDGKEAKEYNERLVWGERVRLVLDRQKRDIYGRLLAYVYTEDGTFVNAEMIRAGYAGTLRIPPNTAHAKEFERLLVEARRAGRGLWSSRGGADGG